MVAITLSNTSPFVKVKKTVTGPNVYYGMEVAAGRALYKTCKDQSWAMGHGSDDINK